MVSYWLELPAGLLDVHDILHVSMLKKHLRDDEQERTVDLSELELQPDLTTVEIPVRVLAREVKELSHKLIPLVKVQWNRHGVEEASWEREEDMCRDFLQLFEDEAQFFFSNLFPWPRPGKMIIGNLMES